MARLELSTSNTGVQHYTQATEGSQGSRASQQALECSGIDAAMLFPSADPLSPPSRHATSEGGESVAAFSEAPLSGRRRRPWLASQTAGTRVT